MGRASRKRRESRERVEMGELSGKSKKLLKNMLRDSLPEVFVLVDKKTGRKYSVSYNPMKKLLKEEKYESTDGRAVTKDMVEKYQKYLAASIAKAKADAKTKETEDGTGTESESADKSES